MPQSQPTLVMAHFGSKFWVKGADREGSCIPTQLSAPFGSCAGEISYNAFQLGPKGLPREALLDVLPRLPAHALLMAALLPADDSRAQTMFLNQKC